MNKIPCTVGILTLNSSKTLRRCLDSVKDFDEIIICDGNSTDNTLDIAREYGCKIVKQYDSDEPNMRCETDKANVRNRNMETARNDWYVYLDSDDALSTGVVEEIRAIASNPNPPFLVYKMPMHTFIAGREIKYSSSYPSYQTRFFNRKTGAIFIKPVHERIKFDPEKYAVGTLQHPYEIHVSAERANSARAYYSSYVDFEMTKWEPRGSFLAYLKWTYRWPIRGLGRTVIFASRNYLFHGFKHSLPVKTELYKAGYYISMIWQTFRKQIGR